VDSGAYIIYGWQDWTAWIDNHRLGQTKSLLDTDAWILMLPTTRGPHVEKMAHNWTTVWTSVDNSKVGQWFLSPVEKKYHIHINPRRKKKWKVTLQPSTKWHANHDTFLTCPHGKRGPYFEHLTSLRGIVTNRFLANLHKRLEREFG
jgi:hypothetical protein